MPSSASDGINGVVFGDPDDEIDGSFNCRTGGTLAVGGVLSDGVDRALRRQRAGSVSSRPASWCRTASTARSRTTRRSSPRSSLTSSGTRSGIDHSCGDQSRCGPPVLERREHARAGARRRARRASRRRRSPRRRGALPRRWRRRERRWSVAAPADWSRPAGSPPRRSRPIAGARVLAGQQRQRAPLPRPVRDRPPVPDAGVVGANTTQMVVRGLASGSTVRFRVAAERRGASSGYSEVVTVTLP